MSLLRVAGALGAISLGLALTLQARSMVWTSQAGAVKDTLKEFSSAITTHLEREGYLPGDINRDGEIDAFETAYVGAHLARSGLIRLGTRDVLVSVEGVGIPLRAISTRASAVAGFPWDIRNVVELPRLTCQVAEELDARNDDGNFATGNIRANVTGCSVGGVNDPVPVVAVALRP